MIKPLCSQEVLGEYWRMWKGRGCGGYKLLLYKDNRSNSIHHR